MYGVITDIIECAEETTTTTSTTTEPPVTTTTTSTTEAPGFVETQMSSAHDSNVNNACAFEYTDTVYLAKPQGWVAGDGNLVQIGITVYANPQLTQIVSRTGNYYAIREPNNGAKTGAKVDVNGKVGGPIQFCI